MASTAWQIPALKKTTASSAASTAVPDYFGTTTGSAVETARAARIPGADPAIHQQFLDAQNLRSTLEKQNAAYTDQLQKLLPVLGRNNEQERSAVDAIYDPTGWQATYQGIRDRQTNALAGLKDVIRGDLTKTLGYHRAGSGSISGAGLSSVMAKIAAAEAGKLRTQQVAEIAAQERADADKLLSARTAAAGQRQSLASSFLSQLLLPGQVQNQSNQTFAAALAQAIQTALANSVTGVATKVTA